MLEGNGSSPTEVSPDRAFVLGCFGASVSDETTSSFGHARAAHIGKYGVLGRQPGQLVQQVVRFQAATWVLPAQASKVLVGTLVQLPRPRVGQQRQA